MKMSSSKSECRKFSPNIFNRSKCQHCFASKDSHSAEALDSNRVTRKVSKCGYLFVAPDWDFSNPLNRTKRWQRRWFVLYDDGELTYSVDEHPETVPQAIIDMTKVLEVSNAEDVTGNKFAIALTLPERVHFIKGTSREESQWWFHELAVFPRSIKNSRYKRNATFPGGKACITKPIEALMHSPDSFHSQSESHLSRRRFLSCDTNQSFKENNNILMPASITKSSDLFKTENANIEIITHPLPNEDIMVSKKNNENLSSQGFHPVSSSNDKVRLRHLLKREKRSPLNPRSHSDTVSYMIKKTFEMDNNQPKLLQRNSNIKSPTKSSVSEYGTKRNDCENLETKGNPSVTQQFLNDKNLEISRKLTEKNGNVPEEIQNMKRDLSFMKPTLDNNQNYCIGIELGSNKEIKLLGENSEKQQSEHYPTFSTPTQKTPVSDDVHLQSEQVRGDPDGCGIDGISSHCSCLSEQELINSHDYLQSKKGWLMLQNFNKDWNKHWFVLKKHSLVYFQDPLAEEKANAEGSLDLSKLQCVEEMESPRHYGFQLVFKDGQKVNITALTSNIRSGWIDAIRKILEQKEWNKDNTLSLGEKIEKEISLIKNLTYDSLPQDDPKQTIADSFSSPRSDMSSDDEFKTASETSGRTEDYFEWADEDGDHNSSSRALPPSPPLNRTPISRVKERARTRSNTRVTSERKEKKRTTNCEQSATTRKDDPVKEDHSGSDREFFSLSDSRRRIRQKKLEKKKSSLLQEVDKKKVFTGDAIKNNSLTDVTLNMSSLENQIAELNTQLNSKNEEICIKNERISELERTLEQNDKSDSRVNEKNIEDQNKLEEKINAEYDKLSNNLEQRLLFSEGKILHLLSEMDYIHQSHQSYVEALTTELEGMKIENGILKEKLQQMYSLSSEKENIDAVSNEKDKSILQYKAEISALKSILNNETSDDTISVVEQFKDLRQNDVPTTIQVKNAGTTFSKNSPDESKINNNVDLMNDNGRTMESALDKDYDATQNKLTRAMSEIRFLKQELKKSHETNDDFELLNIKLRQDLKNLDDDYGSQISLMKVRIEDLTSKLTSAEKNNRQLKQRIMRQDNKEQRRTRSLKGKESFTFGKELETKLEELEKKMDCVEKNLGTSNKNEVADKYPEVSSLQTSNKEIAITEQSLSSSSASVADPLKFLVRMNDLERKVQGASEKLQALKLIPSSMEEISLCLNDIHLAEKRMPSNVELSEEDQNENQRLESTSRCISSLVSKCIKITEEQLTCCNCRQIHGKDLLVNTLQEIEKLLKSRSVLAPSYDFETVQQIVLKIKHLLKKKFNLLDATKSSLKNYSLSSPKAVLELWVERILSETFLMGRISYLLEQLCEKTNLYQLKRVRSCYLKMVSFEKKLWRLHSNLNSCSTVDITSLDPTESSNFTNLFLLQNIKEIFLKLEHHGQVIKKLFDSYKKCSIKNLSKLLAYKTITRSQTLVENADCVVNSKIEQPLEPSKLSAPDVLSKKLIEAEIHHIISIFSKIFEEKIFLELEMTFSPSEEEKLKRAEHTKTLKSQLSREMDLVLHELQDSYHDSLSEIQLDSKLNQAEINNVTVTLAEFICTVAQNVITIAHFNYLKETVQDVPSLDFLSGKEFLETAYDSFDTEESVLNIDIEEYVNKNSIVKEELITILPYLNEIFPLPDSALKRYISVQDILQTTSDGKPSYFMNSYEARLQRSFRRGQRSVTLPICTTNSGTPSPEKQVCLNCQKLQEEMNTLKALHADSLKAAKAEYEETIASLETKFKEDISSIEKNYLDNIKSMQEQICKMEKKQIGKQEEYDQEITALKETYEQEIVQKIDTKVNEEMIRQKYQAEIEQLRGLCEKGLVAMENSHRRIIAELEEKHHRELEVLQVEKEQALAEETQATLAALDAMRKAHEAELQREIAKFKQEFLQKMQTTHEMDVIHKEHEGEMDTIKQEILSLSEKYSIKCLENASLEERLDPLTRQLTDANTLIFDLTARNKQLRAMLEMSSTGLQAILDAECSAIDFDKLKALKIQLQLKETELYREKETVAELEQKLSVTKKNEHELHNQCRFLDQSLKAERQLREDEVSSLRDRLEHIILTSNAPVKGTNQTHLFNLGDQSLLQISMPDHKMKMENIFKNELVRSPSCPGLNVSESFPLDELSGTVLVDMKPFTRISEKK